MIAINRMRIEEGQRYTIKYGIGVRKCKILKIFRKEGEEPKIWYKVYLGSSWFPFPYVKDLETASEFYRNWLA